MAKSAARKRLRVFDTCVSRGIALRATTEDEVARCRTVVRAAAIRVSVMPYRDQRLRRHTRWAFAVLVVVVAFGLVSLMTVSYTQTLLPSTHLLPTVGMACIGATVLGLISFSRRVETARLIAVLGIAVVGLWYSFQRPSDDRRVTILTGLIYAPAVYFIAWWTIVVVLFVLIRRGNRQLDTRAIVIIGLLDAIQYVITETAWLRSSEGRRAFIALIERVAQAAEAGLSMFTARQIGDSRNVSEMVTISRGVAAGIRELKRPVMLANEDVLEVLERQLVTRLVAACLGNWKAIGVTDLPPRMPGLLWRSLKRLGAAAVLLAAAYIIPAIYPTLVHSGAVGAFRATLEIAAVLSLLPLPDSVTRVIPAALGTGSPAG